MDHRQPTPDKGDPKTKKVVAVIAARNEEDYIGATIESLKKQTHPVRIIVINDGSTDDTLPISKNAGCDIVNLPYHKESYVSKPEIAAVWNQGLDHAKKLAPDYIMISGADHIYPPNYVETCLNKLNVKTAIVSGRIDGQPINTTYPRGSGRIVDTQVWDKISGCLYPVCYGWESYIIYKAQELGFKTEAIPELISRSRRLTYTPTTARNTGRGMHELGYYLPQTLAECSVNLLKSPLASIAMFHGYMTHRLKLDCFNYVRETQRKNFVKKITSYLRGEGR